MSHNIDTIEILSTTAWMYKKDIEKLANREDELPEMCFLEEHLNAEADDQGRVMLKSFEWAGTRSGRSQDFLRKKVAKYIHGRIEVLLIWEGFGPEGLIIEDGKEIKCNLRYILDEI